MKYLDEYRDGGEARKYAAALGRIATRPWTIMEVCGGQTHAIVRFGLHELLPSSIDLVHGPGCPVCVTPVGSIDAAVSISLRPGVVFCSFGDMLRVRGTKGDLLTAKAHGADVRIVYSPLDALEIARAHPNQDVVFFAVGFETTAPANAMAIHAAREGGVSNFYVLVSHVLVPPAMETILRSPANRVQAFLAAGHVCAVMGTSEYEPLCHRYKVPIVVTGFEPLDLLQGLLMAVKQLEDGRAEVENAYARIVRPEGNPIARTLVEQVFHVVPRNWRGIGPIASSGLELRPDYAAHDAERRFGVVTHAVEGPSECKSGLVLQGLMKPPECPAFGTRCTPESPLGASMVSSEGACAAYYRYAPSAP